MPGRTCKIYIYGAVGKPFKPIKSSNLTADYSAYASVRIVNRDAYIQFVSGSDGRLQNLHKFHILDTGQLMLLRRREYTVIVLATFRDIQNTVQ